MKHFFYILALMLSALPAVAQTQAVNENPAKKNLIVKEWNTDARTNNKFLDRVTTYNEYGKKVEEIEYNSMGQVWRKRYEHDGPNGRVSKEYLYDHHNRLVNYKVYEYNELGRKMQTTYYPNGKVKTIKVYEYSVREDTQNQSANKK